MRNKRQFFLAEGEHSSPLRGYAWFAPIGDGYDIIYIKVMPEYRRQGMAQKLIAGFIDKINPKSIMLEVRQGNLAAIGLYERLGFEVVSERKGYYSDGEDALVMKLEL